MVGTSALISDTASGSVGLQLGFLTGGEVTLGLENLHQSINHRRYDLNPYNEQALAAEIEKLSVGASTTFLVIQYQRDLAQAQSAEVAARAACLKTMAALDRARGTLLARHAISLH